MLVCDDSEIDDRVNREACRAVGLRSMVVQPLFHRERPIGVVKVMSAQAGALGAEVPRVLGIVAATVARLGGDEFGVLFPLDAEGPDASRLGRQWADERLYEDKRQRKVPRV
jgi:hypothetical protein